MTTRRTLPTPLKSFAALLGTVLFLATAQAQTPSVTPNHTVYLADEDIGVAFADGPGNAKDWIGVYPAGITPGPGSTIWRYVDNTQTGSLGLQEGAVTFPGGLNTPGDWVVYLLLNDGYTPLAQAPFTVVDPTATLVRTDKRVYTAGDNISVTFTNGPGNAKDWLGLYRAGVVPGPNNPSITWAYVDGTQAGNAGLTSGTVTFTGGLATADDYTVQFLLNDGYDVLAGEAFAVVAPSASTPRILSVQPAANTIDVPPVVAYLARITNGTVRVQPTTVRLHVDGALVSPEVSQVAELVTVAFSNPVLYPPASSHTYRLTLFDDATPAASYTNEITVTVASYRNIVLPPPLHFENFDATPEDSLPAGWTQKSYTEVVNADFDLGNLDSASYAKWTVVVADRFLGSFVTYSNPDNPEDWETDYRRVLSVNPLVVKDGLVYGKPLAEGRFAFANSGYRNGASQVDYLYSPDFDVTGKTNVHLAFHSLWEQNQDSIAAVEYSIDQGQSWLPVAFVLDGPDVAYTTNSTSGEVSVDAVTTFTADQTDTAFYTDDFGVQQGGTYGAFIAAPITAALAPFIQARVDNDPIGSKRIELFRLPQADNQSKVRLRFAHAGTDSWYFGIDNVGLYALPSDVPAPTLSISRNGDQITLTWPAAGASVLKSSPSLSPAAWTPVPGVTGNSYTVTASGTAQFYILAP